MLLRDRLQQLLDQKGWNQSDLARAIGEHRNWVNKRLTGQTDIKGEDIPRIAKAMGISPSAFFEEGPAPSLPTVTLDTATINAIAAAVREGMRKQVQETVRDTVRKEIARDVPPAVEEGTSDLEKAIQNMKARVERDEARLLAASEHTETERLAKGLDRMRHGKHMELEHPMEPDTEETDPRPATERQRD